MTKAEQRRDARYRRRLKINGEPITDATGLRRAKIINDHNGHGYGLLFVWLHRITRLELALVCALAFQESGARRVYGHDPVRNPIKSPPGGLKFVTRVNYAIYKRFRKLGFGMQGVNIWQLTWFTYQDDADALGGCWREKYSGLVACRHMKELVRIHGDVRGIALYNGAGPAADAYSRVVRAERDIWRQRLR